MAITTFFADTVGTYRIRLVVNDGVQNSAPVTFTMEISENLPPIANVSLSENSGVVAVPLVLDGTRSSDPEMDRIGFNWSIISQPPGSSFQIADATSAVTTVTFDTAGEYRAQLVVSDGFSNSAPVSFLINISENLAPTANVSLSQNSGVVAVPILLDGSRSSDPENQPLTYRWSIIDQPDGSTFSIAAGEKGQAALTVDTIGIYRAQLIVNDAVQDSAPVRFQISVGANEPPVANVSLSQNSGVVAVPIKLNGTRSSDPEGQSLTYQWEIITQPAGSDAAIIIPKAATPEFTADTIGAYRVQLTVNDGFQDSTPVRFVINVGANQPPVANVSLSQNSGAVGVPIRLNGSRSSDPENQPLTYRWEIITQPAGSNIDTAFSGPNGTLTVDTEGAYRAQLIVNDGFQDSAPVRFLITVAPNLAPTANVSLSDNVGMVESPIGLNGTRSSDPEGQALTYLWEVILQPPGSVVDIEDPTAAVTTWVADVAGLYRMRLTVSDGLNTSAPVRFLVNVADESGNSRPIANVSLSGRTGVVGLFTRLDGTRSSDPDGDPLTYEWSVISQPDGSQFGIINEFAAQTEITFDTPGLYRIQLVVSDGMLDSFPRFFLIDVASPGSQPSPLADARNDGLPGDDDRDETDEVRALDAFFDELGH